MRIDVALLPELAGGVEDSICIVIDVLRATTTIGTLFERGCPRVYAAAGHDQARLFGRPRNFVLCGETDAVRVEDFDYGNSPAELAALDFHDRPAVISTTNGTRAIQMVASASGVLLASARNRAAACHAAWSAAADAGRNVVVVCSGTQRSFTLEDTIVAGMCVEHLHRLSVPEMPACLTDSAIAARRLWQNDGSLIRSWMEGVHAQTLAERGFGDDVAYCASIDVSTVVPILVSEGEAASVRYPVSLAAEVGREQAST